MTSTLSKTAFLRGRQCPLRIWLENRKEEYGDLLSEYKESSEPFVKEAKDVERLAAYLFHGRDVAFGERIAIDDFYCEVDVIEKTDAGIKIWEVKASSSIKPLFHWDLAFQWNVLVAAGFNVVSAGVIYLRKEFVRKDEAGVAASDVLKQEDCTANVQGILDEALSKAKWLASVMHSEEMPTCTPMGQCKGSRNKKSGDRPDDCPHLSSPDGHCKSKYPLDWAGYLPRLTPEKWSYIHDDDGCRMADVDLDLDPEWTPPQLRFIKSAEANDWIVEREDLRELLAPLDEYPISYVDFEYVPACGIPPFEGMSPNQKLPFQWSLGIQDEPGGALRHINYLHPDGTDPRRYFIESLLKDLPEKGPVIVHNKAAENAVLGLYKKWFDGQYQQQCLDISNRLHDTCEIARKCFAHPKLQGSFSIKKFAPVLCDGEGYDDLSIQNGMIAVHKWQKYCESTNADERHEIESDLKAYCDKDATLMKVILEKMRTYIK